MIREIVSYESSDGTRFDNYWDCEKYEKKCIVKDCLRKFDLSKDDFDRMTDRLGIRGINYFFNVKIDYQAYANALENLIHKLNNDTEMEKADLYLVFKTLCVYIEIYHSVEHK